MQLLRRLFAIMTLATLGALGLAGAAMADQPKPWEMDMQAPGSPVEARIQSLNDLVLWIIVVITVFVAGLLLYACFRFDKTRNPVPSRTSHNTLIEVAWTLIPVLILVVIAIPSFSLVFYEDRTTEADMTIKATGHQWFWEFTYPDSGNLDFASYILPQDQLKPGQLKLLDVDNQLVVPVGKNIRILTTSADVIHSFFIPSLGVQRYAIPGHTIETWMRVERPGTYYGECNQICGTNHSEMPIAVHAVSDAEFQAWLVQAKVKFAAADTVKTATVKTATMQAEAVAEPAPPPGAVPDIQLAAAQIQH